MVFVKMQTVFQLLVQFSCLYAATSAAPNSKRADDHHATEYDIIVVGSGAGGMIAAVKFAEAGLNTLLVDKGGVMYYVDGNREIPEWTLVDYPNNTLTRHDAMMYYQANGQTSPGGAAYYCPNLPVGQKAICELGGGTSINAMQQFWPTTKYLDNTFSTVKGWSSADFQPAIQRLNKRIPMNTYWSADNKYYFDEVYGLIGPVLQSIGLKEVDVTVDVNNQYNTYGRDTFASQNGLRGGPTIGYLQDAKKLPNFTLLTHTNVTSVSRVGSHITGIIANGTTPILAKNVVISAGVFNTPFILWSSGIGPKAELVTAAKFNYTTSDQSKWIINNGVGANLHDNPQTSISIVLDDPTKAPMYNVSDPLGGTGLNKDYLDMLFSNHTGPLAGIGRILSAWFQVPYGTGETEYMVMQTLCSTPTKVNGSFACQFNLNEGALSRGNVSLDTTTGGLTYGAGTGIGPWVNDAGGVDAKVYAEGVKMFVDALRATPGFTVTVPAANVTDYVAYIIANARISNNHWGGACSVGPTDGTKGGVDCVDENTKVYGTDNLFVIDGSLSRAPTTSNCAMLYEAMAELASAKVIQLLK